MNKPQFIVTKDGSHSLWVPDLNETYHSTHGAIQESKHVFIHHGLLHWFKHQAHPSVSILEIGLGTGLNALLTYMALSEKNIRATYTGLEPYPIPWGYVQHFNYAAQLTKKPNSPVTRENLQATFEKLHGGEATSSCQLSNHFMFQKKVCTLQAFCAPPNTFDIIYFDVFSPSKQPAMWDIAVLQKISEIMKRCGVMVTYCAQGKLKRHLKQLGMHVETLPGPPGKKEITRASW